MRIYTRNHVTNIAVVMGTALSCKSGAISTQNIYPVVRVLWFALLIIGMLTALVPPSLAADTGPLTARVRQTGGGALSGAIVCVLNVIYCNDAPRTSRNGIATVPNVPYGNITVVIVKTGFYTQERTISFHSRTPTQQFILSPSNASAPPPAITSVSASGPATRGESNSVSISWRTNRTFNQYAVSNFPAVPPNDDWASVSPSTGQTVSTTVQSPSGQPLERGQLYRVYVHVRNDPTGEAATREVRLRYGQVPSPTVGPTRDYVVSGKDAVAEVIELADQRGFVRSATKAEPFIPTRYCSFGHRAMMFARFQKFGPSLVHPQISCAFSFFGGRGGPRRLADGWYIKDIQVDSIEVGEAQRCSKKGVYLLKRPNARSPHFVVYATPSLPPRCVYVIEELTFRGPQNADGWRAAFR